MLFHLIVASIVGFVASTTCPDEALQWNSKCYVLHTNISQFSTALLSCKAQGGDLVSIHDAFLNSLLNDYVANHVTNVFLLDFWTGGSKLFTPGAFSWSDGSPFDYTVWGPGDPRNETWANCIEFYVPGGRWQALDCTTRRPYFCQLPLSK